MTNNRYNHHFQEGNLPTTSKCVKCKKTCGSAECLTGMRCQWCGMSAHSSCVPNIPSSLNTCQFGLLEPIFLPPQAISIPRNQFTQEKTIASKSHALMQARKLIYNIYLVNLWFPMKNENFRFRKFFIFRFSAKNG